jgi:subtilisin family serine protease
MTAITLFMVLLTFIHSFEINGVIANSYSDTIPYGIDLVEADKVWSQTHGSTEVIVAVLDSGFNLDHPDLQDVFWNNSDEIPDNGIDDDGNQYVDDYCGWDFINQNNNVSYYTDVGFSLKAHGTHVTGTIAAQMNNYGIVGMAPNITIMPLRILNKNDRNPDTVVAEAIRYAADNGARIISMSINIIDEEITNDTSYALVEEAIEYAYYTKGALLVAAAGNDGKNTIGRPANNESVIAVGAIDESKEKTWFSNYGTGLEVVAPGSQVNSTGVIDGSHPIPFYVASGTSMATPHVAGALALLLSYNSTLTNTEARTILRQTAEDLASPGWDSLYGFGLINVSRAIGSFNQLESNTSNPTDPFTSTSTTPTSFTNTSKSSTTLSNPTSYGTGWIVLFVLLNLALLVNHRKKGNF